VTSTYCTWNGSVDLCGWISVARARPQDDDGSLITMTLYCTVALVTTGTIVVSYGSKEIV
jgi:hypothetical protein